MELVAEVGDVADAGDMGTWMGGKSVGSAR